MGLFSQRRVAGIAAEALTFAREAAEDTHPNEFMGLLRVTRADRLGRTELDPSELVVTDIVIVPATRSSPVEATLKTNLVPNDGRTVGSIHSHPNGVLRPSDADLASFSRGVIHIILGAPYGREDWQAFDRDGEPRALTVLDVDLEDAEDFFDFDQHDIDEELNR
jgi:proteasome lid subunit RPN8/RPN11